MPESQRIDLWLWHARFIKTRSLAAALVNDGKVRVNGTRAVKASHRIKPGDVLTFVTPAGIQVIGVISCSTRRGPASEARQLYERLETDL